MARSVELPAERLPAVAGLLQGLTGREGALAAQLGGIEGVRLLLELDEGQARAQELRALESQRGAEVAINRSAKVVQAVNAARQAEFERFERLGSAIGRAFERGHEPDPDSLAKVFGVDGAASDSGQFADFMEDRDKSLRLGPQPQKEGADSDDRKAMEALGRIARPAERPPLDRSATATLLELTTNPDQLSNAPGCGLCVDSEGTHHLIVGDGTALSVKGGELARAEIQAHPLDRNARILEAHRWQSGFPPLLLPPAVASYALALGTQRSLPPGVTDTSLGPFLMLGAALPTQRTRMPGMGNLAGLARELRRTWAALQQVRSGVVPADGAIPAAFLKIAYEVSRVTFCWGPGLTPDQVAGTRPAIDVGRIRWCPLSGSVVTWLPLLPEDRNTVGGGDRPWTLDIPAAGAEWHSVYPALRRDPRWFCRIVVIPGKDPASLWCLDPGGGYWALDAHLDAIISRRRAHLVQWLAALEALERQVPSQIKALSRLAGPQKPPSRSSKGHRGSREKRSAKSAPPQKFSFEWVIERVERYQYKDDSGARAAGARAANRGHYTRVDFLTVVEWKSPRTLPLAEKNPSAAIKAATGTALATSNELARIGALLSLTGVGIPVASALLHFAFPDDYPILDYRALATLGDERRRTQYSPRFWIKYLERCRAMARDAGVHIRELDKALWQASRERERHE